MATNRLSPEEARMPKGELALWVQLRKQQHGWVRQYRFAPPRRWTFDFALPEYRLAVEVDGGSAWQGHGQVSRREGDYEKANEAVARGWRVLRGSTEQAENGTLLTFVRRCMPDHH